MEEKLSFLIGAIILFLLILSWPIYFFTVSIFSIIPLGTEELIFFASFEVVLVILLVGLWEFYKRKYKKWLIYVESLFVVLDWRIPKGKGLYTTCEAILIEADFIA